MLQAIHAVMSPPYLYSPAGIHAVRHSSLGCYDCCSGAKVTTPPPEASGGRTGWSSPRQTLVQLTHPVPKHRECVASSLSGCHVCPHLGVLHLVSLCLAKLQDTSPGNYSAGWDWLIYSPSYCTSQLFKVHACLNIDNLH